MPSNRQRSPEAAELSPAAKRRKLGSDAEDLEGFTSDAIRTKSQAVSSANDALAHEQSPYSEYESVCTDSVGGTMDASDLQDHYQCTSDQFLKAFLSRCLPEADRQTVNKDELLDKCLNAVLPLCHDAEMKAHLTEYCTVGGHEASRHAPFVKAFNYALQQLRDLAEHPLREAHASQCLFHVDVLKPAVVLVPLAAARRVAGQDQHASWAELAYNSGTAASNVSPEWTEILLSLEFRCTLSTLARPLPRYTTELRRPVAAAPGGRGIFQYPDRTLAHGATSKTLPPPYPSKRPPIPRCAIYGAERLCSSIAMTHAMSLLIVDDVAWLWWYDRQGAIQSTGVDIVKDLPRFLVLLLAMQRFSSEDWGVNPALGGAHPDPIEPGSALPAGPVTLTNNDGQVITLQLIEDILLRVRLRGRATRVIRALSPSPHPFTMVSLEGRPLVVKLSSPEEQRESEVKVLQVAQKAAMANADIDGHIPEVIFACDLGYSTGTIRDELGELWLAPDAAVPACLRTIFRPARVLRLIVFEELEPIVSRSGRDFLTAWVECVKCHYALWAAGVEHSDPSLDNLMVRVTRAPDGAEAVSGVMNDWDLANLRGISQHTGLERTGTLPFQALELLTDEYWRGEVERLYRHDLEALIWVLPWVFLRMRGERTVKNPPLEAWQTSKYRTCYVKKLVFLGDMPDYSASPSWKIEWRWGGQLLRWLKLEKTRREYLATDFDAWNGGQLAKEQDNWDAEYQKFWKVYKYAATRASLDYLVALIPSGI